MTMNKGQDANNLPAIGYMMMAVLMLASMDAVAKWLVEAEYSVFQIIAVRGWMNVTMMIAIMPFVGGVIRLKTARPYAHAARTIIGFFAPILFFAALYTMPLAEATVLFFISPFVMTALSVPLFGERVGIHRWGAVLVGFGGVLYVVQPTASVFNPAALLVLAASLCYAAIMLSSRWLARTEHTYTIVFYNNFGAALMGSLVLPFVWKGMPMGDLTVMGLMAVLSLAGHFFIVKAFTMGEVGVITPFEYSGLIWAVLLGFLVFQELPTRQVWIGMTLIALSGLYMVYRENQNRKKER